MVAHQSLKGEKYLETIVLGRIGQHIFEIEMLKRGWDLYTPLLENTKIDCIAIRDNKILRFQVKLLDKEGALPVRKISHNQGEYKIKRYTSKDIDFFVGIDRDTHDVYIVPISIVEQYSISIGKLKLQQYKNNFSPLEPYIGNNISGGDDIGKRLTANTEGKDNILPVESR